MKKDLIGWMMRRWSLCAWHDDLDFGFEVDVEFFFDCSLSFVDEGEHFFEGSSAFVEEEIGVFVGDAGFADTVAFEAGLVDEHACRLVGAGVFEERAGGGAEGLFGEAEHAVFVEVFFLFFRGFVEFF